MNHLWDIQEINSQLAYRTNTQMIARVCLGSEPDLLRTNKPLGLLNTKVMKHHRKNRIAFEPQIYKKLKQKMNRISGIF